MFYFCSFFNQIKQKTPKKQRYTILLQNVITYVIYIVLILFLFGIINILYKCLVVKCKI